MAQEFFYIARSGQQEGPISFVEILQRLEMKTLQPSDYLYDEAQSDWVMLLMYPRLAERLKSHAMKPKSRPKEDKWDDAKDEWYVLKGDHRFGPFAYLEVIRMLQDKSLFESDYAWNVTMSSWEPISELKEFAPQAIRALLDSGFSGVNEVFFRRRHVRANYGASLLVHNNKQVFKGKSIEVSAGGAGIILESDALVQGEKIYLHFKPGDGVPPFNAACEIVSKRHIDASDKAAPVQYGVRFNDIPEATQFILNDYATKKAVA